MFGDVKTVHAHGAWGDDGRLLEEKDQDVHRLLDERPDQADWRRPSAGLEIPLRFNAAHRDYLEKRLTALPHLRDEIVPAQAAAAKAAQVYIDLRDYHEGKIAVARRLALKRVRETLGAAGFHAGTLPPPIPSQNLKDGGR